MPLNICHDRLLNVTVSIQAGIIIGIHLPFTVACPADRTSHFHCQVSLALKQRRIKRISDKKSLDNWAGKKPLFL